MFLINYSFGGGQPNISQTLIKSFSIPLPPPLHEQRAIADFLNAETQKIDALIEADLVTAGYFKREPESYNKSLCLDPELLINFIIATQPEKWEVYKEQLGGASKRRLFK